MQIIQFCALALALVGKQALAEPGVTEISYTFSDADPIPSSAGVSNNLRSLSTSYPRYFYTDQTGPCGCGSCWNTASGVVCETTYDCEKASVRGGYSQPLYRVVFYLPKSDCESLPAAPSTGRSLLDSDDDKPAVTVTITPPGQSAAARSGYSIGAVAFPSKPNACSCSACAATTVTVQQAAASYASGLNYAARSRIAALGANAKFCQVSPTCPSPSAFIVNANLWALDQATCITVTA